MDVHVNDKIRHFLSHHFPQAQLEDETNIFERGFVNSLFAMQLVLYIENEFYIQVDNDDLNMDNFKSIHDIVHFVQRKLHQPIQ